MKIDVLGVSFDDLTMDRAVAGAMELLEAPGYHYIVTPNPELVTLAGKDETFRQSLAGAALTLADGVGVTYAAKLLGRPLQGRVPGIDFAGRLMEELARTGGKLFLLGAKPGVARQAADNLTVQYPGLTVCGVHDGYFQEDAPVIEAIRSSGAEVLFVCLGAPKQENWMACNGAAAGVRLAVGLGGSLDVFAGVVQRAPELWRKLGLEWLYRLLKEPSRIGRMACLPLFLARAAWAGIRGR